MSSMPDGTRLIFWVDMLVLLVVAMLIIAHQWDWVIALFVALIVLNFFDQWTNRRQNTR